MFVKKSNILILLTLLLAYFLLVLSQNKDESKEGFLKNYINKVFNDSVSQEKSQFFLYPTVGDRPETGVEFGLSPLYVCYTKLNL